MLFLCKNSRKGGRIPVGKRYLTLYLMDLDQKAIEGIQVASEMSLRLYCQPLVITDSGGKGQPGVKAARLRENGSVIQ